MDRIYTALTALIIVVCLLIIVILVLTLKVNRYLSGENKAQTAMIQPLPLTETAPSAHIKAAIVAAISAYYAAQPSEGTEFIVRRIKRL